VVRVAANEVIPANPTEFQNAGANTFNLYNFSNIPVSEYMNPKTGDSDFGPFPSNMTGRDYFHSPGAFNLDLGIYKSMRFTERMSLQLRLEAFNALNHSNEYVNYSSTLVTAGAGNISASYGVIPNTATVGPQLYENRNIQLGAKFIF